MLKFLYVFSTCFFNISRRVVSCMIYTFGDQKHERQNLTIWEELKIFLFEIQATTMILQLVSFLILKF